MIYKSEEGLKQLLIDLEQFKAGVTEQLIQLKASKNSNLIETTVYPLGRTTQMMITDYPVFQFSYESMLPVYTEDKKYLRLLRHYYMRATLDSYNFKNMDIDLGEVVIVFVQYFKNNIVRDLENRVKKFIQDAINHTGIIKDDDWKTVWNADIGFKDKEREHVQVYVVPRDNFAHFYRYLLEHHHEMKEDHSSIINREQILRDIKVALEEKERVEKVKKEEENTKFKHELFL